MPGSMPARPLVVALFAGCAVLAPALVTAASSPSVPPTVDQAAARVDAPGAAPVASLAPAGLPGLRLAPLPSTTPAAAGMSAARLDRLHAFLRENTAPGGYLGGVTLLTRHGRIVDWQAYGFRDLARSRPMQRDDIFRIYSMSKTITAVAVLILFEEGKLSLDDPVAQYLPELGAMRVLAGGTADAPQWRAPARPLTLRHLLTHTSGFPAGLPGDAEADTLNNRDDPHRAPDLAGFVTRLSHGALAADPGTRFGYEAANAEVLARVVEVASGQDFAGFLQSRILGPLDMRDTGFEVPAAQRARVVDITVMGPDGKLRLADGPSASAPGTPLNAYASGAGGLYSTAGDYARFCQMLLDGGSLDGAAILAPKTVEMMLSNHLTGILDPPVDQYSGAEGFGLGGYVVLDPARRGAPGSVGQFGWSGAASTNYFIDPREGMSEILMLQHLPNGAPGDLPRIGRQVQNLAIQALGQ
jgi:CubicO group peptidase (beta-lactamase class C family)